MHTHRHEPIKGVCVGCSNMFRFKHIHNHWVNGLSWNDQKQIAHDWNKHCAQMEVVQIEAIAKILRIEFQNGLTFWFNWFCLVFLEAVVVDQCTAFIVKTGDGNSCTFATGGSNRSYFLIYTSNWDAIVNAVTNCLCEYGVWYCTSSILPRLNRYLEFIVRPTVRSFVCTSSLRVSFVCYKVDHCIVCCRCNLLRTF